MLYVVNVSTDSDLARTYTPNKQEDEEELLGEGEDDPNSVESVKRSILAYMETRRAVCLLLWLGCVSVAVRTVCVQRQRAAPFLQCRTL